MLHLETQCYKKDSNGIVGHNASFCKSTRAPMVQAQPFRFSACGMECKVGEHRLLACSEETEEKSMPTYTDPRAHTREEISRMVDLLGSFWLDDQQVINAVAHDHERTVEVLLTLEGGAQRRLVFLVKPEEC
jgi:hypothetical protein